MKYFRCDYCKNRAIITGCSTYGNGITHVCNDHIRYARDGQPIEEPKTQVCTLCGQEKSTEEFYICGGVRRSECKACNLEQRKKVRMRSVWK